MVVVSLTEQIRVIDTDTHVVEPPDLWTSRLPTHWGELVPHVEWDEANAEEAWFINGQRVAPVASAAQAGWPEYPPLHPRRWDDADPATWDAKARLARMDENGIYAQMLYPNVALFNGKILQSVGDPAMMLGYIRAYNDWQTEL
jgi:uncharacterized protein